MHSASAGVAYDLEIIFMLFVKRIFMLKKRNEKQQAKQIRRDWQTERQRDQKK